MNMLQSETLINEEGLVVNFSGEIDRVNMRIDFYLDRGWLNINTNKKSERGELR